MTHTSDHAGLVALREVRGHFDVEYFDDGSVASVGHDSEALRKIVKTLDEAIAALSHAPETVAWPTIVDKLIDEGLPEWHMADDAGLDRDEYAEWFAKAHTLATPPAAQGKAAQPAAEEISPYEWLAQEWDRRAILRKMWSAYEVAAMIRRHDIERPANPPASQPALALIEELERALEKLANDARAGAAYWNGPQQPSFLRLAETASTALASIKAFKGV